MKNLIKRSITGLLFIIIIIVGISFHKFGFYAVFATANVLTMREFYKLTRRNGVEPQMWIGILLGIILFTACFIHAHTTKTLGFILLIFMVVILFIVEIYRNKKEPLANIAYTLMGLIYVGLPFTLLNYLMFPFADKIVHPELVTIIFVMIWANDSGAYIFGVSFGKHRLFKRISPKKSWEGTIGGALTTFLTAWISSKICLDLSLFHWTMIALIVTIFGSFGDLTESMFKRNLQIKDSGSILPGHGGILDRFDAVLLAIPMIFIYLQVIKEFFN